MNISLELLKNWILHNGSCIVLIIVIMAIALKMVNGFSGKLVKNLVNANGDPELEKRGNTLQNIIKSLSDILVISIGIIMILEKMGIEIGPILAAAGILGVAVGFGSQRLVEDFISGFIILLEDQIRVGDVVQIGAKSGLVEKVDLKMVVLRDIEGNVHYIRNGKIDIITNKTKDYSRYVFDINISYKENIDKVMSLIKQVDEELRNDAAFKEAILEPIEILGLDKLLETSVIIKARIKTQTGKQWAVGREFNRRLKHNFDLHKIESQGTISIN